MIDAAARGLAAKALAQSPGKYLGQVATRGTLCYQQSTANQQMMARSRHLARDHITSIQVAWPNWSVSLSRVETGSGGSATITAAVEYPAGTFTQLKFSGAVQGAVADAATIFSDFATVNIPAGAEFWIRAYYVGSVGMIYNNNGNDTHDTLNFAPSGLSDQTMGGTVTNKQAGLWWGPCAILSYTTRPSVWLAGDSRMFGIHDATTDPSGGVGQVGRIVAPSLAFINGGISGDRVNLAISNYTRRLALAQYCTHAIVSFGINDLTASRTAAQVAADLTTFAGLLGDKPAYLCTVSPDTTSTDSWATTTNQTAFGQEAARVSLNALIRAGVSGYAGVFDIADVTESARNSGLWAVNGSANYATNDGLHESAAMNQLISRSAGIARTDMFYRVP